MSDNKHVYTPLTEEDLNAITASSQYPDDFKEYLSNNFVGLDKLCSISMGIDCCANVDVIFEKLNKQNLNIARSDKKEPLDINKVLVGEKGIETPILSPREALLMAVKVYDVLKQEYAVRGFALPKTIENLCHTSAHSGRNINVCSELEVNSKSDDLKKMLQERNLSADEFISSQLKESNNLPDVDIQENTEKNFCKSLYRGGTLGCNPYAVVSSNKAKDCAYATPDMRLAKYYSTGLEAGYDRAKVDGLFVSYGFIYEFEAKKDQRYFTNYGIENGEDYSEKKEYSEESLETLYETPVFAHQNPLKGIYLVANDRVIKITDDKGQFISKDWENFVQLHETHFRHGDEYEKKYNEERLTSILSKDELPINKKLSINKEEKNLPPMPPQQTQAATPPPLSQQQIDNVGHVIHEMRMGNNPLLEQAGATEQKTAEKEAPEISQEIIHEESVLVQEVKIPETPVSQNDNNTKTDNKYDEAAKQFIEKRAKLHLDSLTPYGIPTEQQKEDVKKQQEYEMKMAQTITKVMEEKGPTLFAGGDSKKVEEILKQQAIKDGLLVEKESSIFGKQTTFNNGSIYIENDGSLYSLAVGIANHKMETEFSKAAPEKQQEISQLKNQYSKMENASKQAEFAMSTVEQLSASAEKTPQKQNQADKNIAQAIMQMRIGNNPLQGQDNQKPYENREQLQTQNNEKAAPVNQMYINFGGRN